MKKIYFTGGIIFLILTVVLVLFGFINRSLFYGIMDAPYSVYGKYGTIAKLCFIMAIITAVISVVCFILGMVRK